MFQVCKALLLLQLTLGSELSDIDVEGILDAAQSITDAEITYISPSDYFCRETAEESCAKEVMVRFTSGSWPAALRISKIEGEWVVGQLQQDDLAYQSCMRALNARAKQMKKSGSKMPWRVYYKKLNACRAHRGGAG